MLKVIACRVFEHEIDFCLSSGGLTADIEYLDLGEHAYPAKLREMLQCRIDDIAAGETKYDAVALAYGLCGRAVDGLTARREKLVIPRSHDCCGILLGSRKLFEQYFRDMPSTPFSSPGYVENGSYFFQSGEMVAGDEYAALVEQYGEDDAKYIYDAMHPTLDGRLQPVYYIENPVLQLPHLQDACRAKAEAEGREFRLLSGDLRLIAMLLSGNWPSDEFLCVHPGESISMVADWDVIFTASARS